MKRGKWFEMPYREDAFKFASEKGLKVWIIRESKVYPVLYVGEKLPQRLEEHPEWIEEIKK